MLALVGLHAVVALTAPAVFARVGRRVFFWCLLAPAATFGWALAEAPGVLDGRPVTQTVAWVPQLGLELSFRMDAFGLLMVVLVEGIGILVFAYAASYFADHSERKLGAFAGQLTGFAGAMFGLVSADNVFFIFVFWELTAAFSYLLIGYEDEKGSARAAARQAILVTSGGGLALLGGLVLLSQAAGTTSLHEILERAPMGGVVPAALLLVVAGAATKSAQSPFHSWLPAAMVAPTPVSAYLHSATMVTAGVYLIARFARPFADVPVWRPVVITMGLATMLVGGYRALRQRDLKLLLAYGTISQLGLMFALLGTGAPGATEAGVAVLLAHALYKAALFLTVGIIDHQAHTRDVRRLSGLGRRLPYLGAYATAAALSMAGVPLFFGFVAKELSYDAYLHGPLESVVDGIVLAVMVVGSVLTVAYAGRFVWGAFARKSPDPGATLVGPGVDRPARLFVAPVAVLAAATVLLGVAPALAERIVTEAAAALDPALHAVGLALWHGATGALGLSALTLVLGVVVIVGRRRVERLQATAPSPAGPDAGYPRAVEGLNWVADRVTGIVQNGSLPTYLAVVMVTVLAIPGVALVGAIHWPDGVRLADSALQVVVVVLLVAAAVAAASARRRFAAVLLVGAVGYTVAALFAIQGGPDLALTQLLVETLTVVLFVLVLRHLPERFPAQGFRSADVGRVLIALGVGAFVTLFTVVAAGSRSEEPVARELAERALPEGGGRNVVNVILTDFRALDTLGEISVLTVTALGITSLVLAGRRADARDRSEAAREASALDAHLVQEEAG